MLSSYANGLSSQGPELNSAQATELSSKPHSNKEKDDAASDLE
jgi:hypothetical protein